MLQLAAIVAILTISTLFHETNGQRYSDKQYFEQRYPESWNSGQHYPNQYSPGHVNSTAVWCTVSKAEQDKCLAFKNAVDREKGYFGRYYVSLSCKRAFNKEECMTMLDGEVNYLTTLDPGEVFAAGRYHSLLPIMQEDHAPGNVTKNYQYTVAVVKKDSLPNVSNLRHLRGTKACFAGAGTLAGWTIPIEILMKHGGLEVIDCNNHVKSTIEFFGPSCAVNSLTDRFNPLGDNSDQLCQLCIGEVPGGRCTNKDPYAGYEGAFRCLLEAGEIAFLVHTTVLEMTSTTFDLNSVTKDQFELLCIDGSRATVDEYERCNWGRVPSRAIVTSSATTQQSRALFARFLENAVRLFSKNGSNSTETDAYGNRQSGIENRPTFEDRNFNKGYDSNFDNRRNNHYDSGFDDWNSGNAYDNRLGGNRDYETTQQPGYGPNGYNVSDKTNHEGGTDYVPIEMFDIFESAPKYGLEHNLLFSDTTIKFKRIEEKDQTYRKYLGSSLNSIMAVGRCTVHSVTLCVTSDPEMKKCEKMRTAMKAQLLKPELSCYRGHSQIHCMQEINNGKADIAVLDASDVYVAGLRYNQVPFIAEVYNLGTPDYYVVAVAKESDRTTDLTYLKNKHTCHTGINTAAGWVYPMAYLISNTWIRGYGCDSVRAAAEYFTKSCVPGALSMEYNIGEPYYNLCHLCYGESFRDCRRDASEPFFGHTGAFRCLVEGGGDVAFVKHTTVYENTNGKRKEFWARNTFTKDFELLCTNGSRNPAWDYKHCNLGKVKANAFVTRGGGYYGYNETEINAYINLFIYAQQFYGRKSDNEFSFSMFSSAPPYSDLIFQDATQQLMVIPPEERDYRTYLGPDFMRARRFVDCEAGASATQYSIIITLAAVLITLKLVP